jgi:AraC family transcriptional regulator
MQSIQRKHVAGTKEFIDIGPAELHISISKFNEDLSSPWHYHEKTYLTLIQKGGNVEHRKDSSFECHPGDLFIYNSDYWHYNDNGKPGSRNFNVEIDDHWFKKYEIDRTHLSGARLLKNITVKTAFLKLVAEVHKNDQYSSLGIESYLLQIFTEILRSHNCQARKNPGWVKRVRDYLSDHLGDVSLSNLSEIANVHPVTLSKEFPVYFGAGFSEYIRNLKCEKVLQLLARKSMSLQQIANATGFCDAGYMVKTFKKRYNLTPAEYRNSLSY